MNTLSSTVMSCGIDEALENGKRRINVPGSLNFPPVLRLHRIIHFPRFIELLTVCSDRTWFN